MREQVHKVEQASHACTIHVHGPMLSTHCNAMLREVGIGAVLEAPALAAELDRDDTKVLARGMGAMGIGSRTARVPLVLHAKLTGRVGLTCWRCSGSSNVTRILLGLRLVDGNLELAPARSRRPGDIARNGRLTHVVHIAAELVEPIGTRLWSPCGNKGIKTPCNLRRARHDGTHDTHCQTVATRGRILRLTSLHTRLSKRGKVVLKVVPLLKAYPHRCRPN